MPELPEVETTRRGILPHVKGEKVKEVIVRRHDLRHPVSDDLTEIEGRRILDIHRRSKYLRFDIDDGSTLLLHLGMSGSLRIAKPGDPFKKHDHVALTMTNGKQLRFHDPRRFGLVLRIHDHPEQHTLLKHLGPEPLSKDFHVDALKAACAKRSIAIKLAIMDAKVVVGVGNIYASEALFRAGIKPSTPANKVTKPRLAKLVDGIQAVLKESIRSGGTTLRDFLHSTGEPGYFAQKLFVYERKGEPCRVCGTPIKHSVLGQRSTYWCPNCQK